MIATARQIFAARRLVKPEERRPRKLCQVGAPGGSSLNSDPFFGYPFCRRQRREEAPQYNNGSLKTEKPSGTLAGSRSWRGCEAHGGDLRAASKALLYWGSLGLRRAPLCEVVKCEATLSFARSWCSSELCNLIALCTWLMAHGPGSS